MTTEIITFEDINLHLKPHQNLEFLLTNKEVADGYGVSIQSLSQAKRNYPDELIEGKHYLRLDTPTNGGVQKVIHWTKRGIVRLGFFIKSERAKKFRDFIEDLTLNKLDEPNYKQLYEDIKHYPKMFDDYAQASNKIFKELDKANEKLAKLTHHINAINKILQGA